MTTETYVSNILGEVTKAKEVGAKKVQLDIDSVISSFTEAQQVAAAAPVLQKLEALNLTTDDYDIMYRIECLLNVLRGNATYISYDDSKLFDDYEAMVARFARSSLFVQAEQEETDEDEDEYYNGYDEDEDEDDVEDQPLSSFRVLVDDEDENEDEDELFEEVVASTPKKKTWLELIMKR